MYFLCETFESSKAGKYERLNWKLDSNSDFRFNTSTDSDYDLFFHTFWYPNFLDHSKRHSNCKDELTHNLS